MNNQLIIVFIKLDLVESLTFCAMIPVGMLILILSVAYNVAGDLILQLIYDFFDFPLNTYNRRRV
jgi:hypothetical protein